jgi:hypothetical protein
MATSRAVAAALVSLLAHAPASSQAELCQQPGHREFDFWLGTWEIRQELLLPDGSWLDLPARSTVTRVAGSCALMEEWRGQVRFFWEGMDAPSPLEGFSVRAYDAEAGLWRIWWLDSRRPDFGAPFEGRFVRGEGAFVREGTTADGNPLLTRIRFHDVTADSVHWELAISRDAGSSWSPLWRMRFRRAAASPSNGQEPALEALLRLHHAHRSAHVLNDPDGLAATFADTLVQVSGGAVARLSRAALRESFRGYLGSVEFLEWENVAAPEISLTPDGRTADVVVTKRVRLLASSATDGTSEIASRYAWTERWDRTNDGWRLARIVSTDAEEPADSVPVVARSAALETLQRARVALGGEAAVAGVAMVAFDADCEGPGGPFHTTVRSARDGRVVFRQEYATGPPFAAGISLTGGWQTGDTGADSLALITRSVIHGHEFPLLVLAPEARFRSPRALPDERFDGRDARVVRFLDLMESPADFLFDAETGLPLGFRIENQTGRGAPDITVRYGDWRAVGAVRLPFSVEIRQGDDLYRYRITRASTDWIDDTAFRPVG